LATSASPTPSDKAARARRTATWRKRACFEDSLQLDFTLIHELAELKRKAILKSKEAVEQYMIVENLLLNM
jgi:hypothetical protein